MGAPASLLQTSRGAQSLPQLRLSGTQPGGHPSAAPVRVGRTLALTLAQLLVVVQGILAGISGINLIREEFRVSGTLGRLGPRFGLNNEVLADGVVVIAIAVLVILAGIRVAHPSSIARWFLIMWEGIAFLFTLGFLLELGFLLSLRDVFVVMVSAAGFDFVNPWLALVMEIAILFGLLVHPATREAFAQ